MSTRAARGKAISAAIYQLRNNVRTRVAAIMFNVAPGSVVSARNRLGAKIMSTRENRRIFNNNGYYCFRYRTSNLNVYHRLSADLEKARIMRNKIEKKLGLSK
jgi:hypothetical protein